MKDKEFDLVVENLEEIVSDVVEEIDEVVESEDDMVVEIKEETEIPLIIRIPFSANLRAYPNHVSRLIKRVRANTQMEVIDITEGSLVALSNIWYQVDGGFVHASQVEVM